MLLDKYLTQNGIDKNLLCNKLNLSNSSYRNLNNKNLDKWRIEDFNLISKVVGKDRIEVIKDLEKLQSSLLDPSLNSFNLGKYNIENRRYIGNKSKLIDWITDLIEKNTEGKVFFDVFGGTGIVTKSVLDNYEKFIINDFLYSNYIIYNAFFSNESFSIDKLKETEYRFNNLSNYAYEDNYFYENYADKFFSRLDAKKIGYIRNIINNDQNFNKKERDILLASLLYSMDKVANTVGHYDAYRKNNNIKDRFIFSLINPLKTFDKEISIFREDANKLVKRIKADIAFIDPPYNSRQYSRFYHVLENVTKWDKPKLSGVAMKPPVENISEYSKVKAPYIFDDLINNLDARYIVVTYNNTYTSKSNSSKNKITHEQIINTLNKVGTTRIFEKPYKFFNAGKSVLQEHKEYVFITKVDKNARTKI
ncbi:DNA adenine methylase [Macrococcus capreoli]|uniref:DNA adenine methylase n=1 Tax=Macrococcus capreoli TaxID=2982690 RepID=UPI003F42D828